MAKMRLIAEEEELKPCTFQPNLDKKYKGKAFKIIKNTYKSN